VTELASVTPEAPVSERLLDRGEAAARLRVSEDTVCRLVASGRLTEVRVTERLPKITEASVDAHIAATTVTTGQGSAA
jgi:excisionase family DNA binding protein